MENKGNENLYALALDKISNMSKNQIIISMIFWGICFLIAILLLYYVIFNSKIELSWENIVYILWWLFFSWIILIIVPLYFWKINSNLQSEILKKEIKKITNIKLRIENIKKLLEEKELDIKINNREVWENYWTLFSKWDAKFLYILDENNDLLSINLYFKNKEKKEEVEEWIIKLKLEVISKEELKNYTSVPNNTIILDTLRDLQNEEDEKIVDEITKLVKLFTQK